MITVSEETSLDDLGFSLRKTIKRVSRSVRRVVRKAPKRVVATVKRTAKKLPSRIKRRVRQIQDPVGTFKKQLRSAREHAKRGVRSTVGYVKRAAKSLAKHPAVALAIPGIGPMLFFAIKARKDPRWALGIPGATFFVAAGMVDRKLPIPAISLALNALNFVVPGLGSLASFATQMTTKALAMHEIKLVMKKMEKRTKAEDAAWAIEEKKMMAEAEKSLDKAFGIGKDYFKATYNVTPEEFAAWPYNDKLRFFQLNTYMMHRDKFVEAGIEVDDYLAMGIGQQEGVLAKLLDVTEAVYPDDDDEILQIPLPGETAEPTAMIIDTPEGPVIAPVGMDPTLKYILIGGGALAVTVAIILIATRK